MRYIVRYILLLLLLVGFASVMEAKQVRVFGYVLDEDNRGVELANAYVEGTTTGTTTNRNGYFDLQVDMTDSVTLVWSMLGYQTIRQRVFTKKDILQINVVLPMDAEMLSEVEVKGIRRHDGTMDHIEAITARTMPDATGGSIESLLITFAGVTQNNELSSQYNVRGGNFDENSVYVNGMEIHRPLLLRAGQQEGLSFVNPEMVQDVRFSAGGFDAQYGDKMSSVLDITYKEPTAFEASANISLLGAGVYVGSGDSTYSMMHGLRYKTSRYMLGALPTEGSYQPNFVDYQTYITWRLGGKRNKEQRTKNKEPKWSMSVLGNFSLNSYRFQPEQSITSFGTFQDAKNLTIYYDGQEKDRFITAFGALGAKGNINKEIQLGFDLSGFYTNEQENIDITGEYILQDKPLGSDASGNTSESETVDPDNQSTADVLGTGIYHEHVRNALEAGVITLSHNGHWKRDNNTLQWGISAQAELITDRISEWEWRDSVGYSIPTQSPDMELYYTMKGEEQMQSVRVQGYVQDTYKWNTLHGDVSLTGGLRMQWWSFNNEFLCSPRLSVQWLPTWKRDFVFRFATGLYYQSPFYKELRDTLTDHAGVTRIHLNDKIRAQRSVQAVLGGDYYFRAWGRPFKLTAEAYGKYMDRVISYTVDNVRVRYSGENDARAYTVGLDLKLYGELVPGAESWVSFSMMRSRENLLFDDGTPDDRGWIPGPNEQRYAFSMLFQDYIPRWPQYRFHLKFICSDALPYGPPRNIDYRAALRSNKPYLRVDLGASREFSSRHDKWFKTKHLDTFTVNFEVFNLIDFKNVNSYFWVTTYNGLQFASPNYLTGRMYNLKLSFTFKE